MMLKEKIRQTQELISKTQKQQEIMTRYKQYEEFLQELKEVYNYGNNFKSGLEILHGFNPIFFKIPDLTKIDKHLNDLANNLPKKNQLRYLKSDLERENENLRKRWQEYVDQASAEKIQMLELLRGFFADQSKFQNCLEKIKELRDRWPLINKNSPGELEAVLKEGQDIIQQLDASEKVRNFLATVTGGQATVTDLTGEITNWLNEHKFSGNLKITFASDQRRM